MLSEPSPAPPTSLVPVSVVDTLGTPFCDLTTDVEQRTGAPLRSGEEALL